MRVVDLLSKIDDKTIIEHYDRMYNDNSDVERLNEWLLPAIKRMRSMRLDEPPKEKCTIIPIFELDDNYEPHIFLHFFDSDEFERFGMSTIKFKLIKFWMFLRRIWFTSRINILRKIDDMYKFFFRSPIKMPTEYGVEFDPWANVLQYEILSQDVSLFGISILCAVIYEMTFWGPEEEKIQNEKNHLAEMAARAKEHPEELIPWESAKELLDVEDELTLEQKKSKILHEYKINYINFKRLLTAIYTIKKD